MPAQSVSRAESIGACAETWRAVVGTRICATAMANKKNMVELQCNERREEPTVEMTVVQGRKHKRKDNKSARQAGISRFKYSEAGRHNIE